MKIVIDSNVLVAAFATRGLCNELFELCVTQHEIFLCDEILEEVRRGLVRSIKAPGSYADDAVQFLKSRAHLISPANVPAHLCRDPKDLMVLGTAEEAKADVLLTGDKDLLVLKRHKRTRIVNPRGLWELLK